MTTRTARSEDWPRIQELHRVQNERDATDYPLTPLSDVVLALVTERSNEGVVGYVAFEPAIEMTLASPDVEATMELASHIEAAEYILRQRGFERLHCLVPKVLLPEERREGPIARILRRIGLIRDDHRLGHFYKDLRG